jgi:type I restriction enzyme R subunit
MREVETLPVFRIDQDYVTKVEQLPTPADKVAALEAALTTEFAEGDVSFTYQQLGERLRRIKERRDAIDEAAEDQLRALEEIAEEAVRTQAEPKRLRLTGAGEYGLFTVLRAYAPSPNDATIAECAKKMVEHLTANALLAAGWSNSKGARMRVEQSLLAESWNPDYSALRFDPDDPAPLFLRPAVDELARADTG